MEEADRIQDLVAKELGLIEDSQRAASLRTLLVTPRRDEREWDYGEPGTHYPYWIVAEACDRRILLVYCEHGFGPAMPWGFLFTNDPDAATLGMDSQWSWYLEKAFVRSGLWQGTIRESEPWNLPPDERFMRST